jgi:hypothetical protein
MLYFVVRVGKRQRNNIMCGEDLSNFSVIVYYVVRYGKGSSMVFCVVRFGKGKINVILSGEIWQVQCNVIVCSGIWESDA